MTVSTSYAPLSFNGDDATTAFAVTWPFFDSSLVVTLVDSTGVETVKTITTHYTVSGGTDSDGLPATGTVTMLTAPASGETLRIERNTSKVQSASWTNGGAYQAKTLEATLDKIILIAQEQQAGIQDDITGDVMQLNTSGSVDYWDAESHIIRNVSNALASTDAVNYGQFQQAVIDAGAGDVVGPASATDNKVARFDGATGKLIQESPVAIDDSGNMTGVGTIDASNVTARVASIAALKALDTSTNTVALLTLAGREGTFLFKSGDYSTEITADTSNAIYAKADDTAASSGSWVRIYDGLPSVKWWGVTADGTTDDTTALQAAFDAMSAGLINALFLVEGEYALNGDITIDPRTSGNLIRDGILIQGAGHGANGTYLHFDTGSLIVNHGNHVIRDVAITSDNDNGLEIKGTTISMTNYYPTRSMLENVRAEYCGGSGITIEDCWIYTMVNIYCRYNATAGLEGKTGSLQSLACNALTIIGGSFTGNGTIVSAGASRGTGAGIITGRCFQFAMFGGTVEGNEGDGVFLSEQLRGAVFHNVYFEKNGSHHENRDITNFIGASLPSSSTNAPNSVKIYGCNFTPQNDNGTAQERAIDLYDVQHLIIQHPQFLAQSGPVLYSAEPIRVREQTTSRCTGWVEGHWYGSASYTQDVLLNSCYTFGKQRKHVFCEELSMADATTTTSTRYVIPMKATYGDRIEVNHLTRPDGATGNAVIVTTIRRGPAGTSVSVKTDTVTYASSVNAVLTENHTQYTSAAWQTLEIDVERQGSDGSDTLAAALTLLATEITVYEGVINESA